VLVGPWPAPSGEKTSVTGPVSIVPAPYGRNLDRLARAARLRTMRVERFDADLWSKEGSDGPPAQSSRQKKLVRPDRWALRCGEYELDVEGRSAETPPLPGSCLYEASSASRWPPEVSVEVASPGGHRALRPRPAQLAWLLR